MDAHPTDTAGTTTAKDLQARRGFNFAATIAYLDWMGRLARHCRRSLSETVAVGLESLAREVGFTEPPPERSAPPGQSRRVVATGEGGRA